MRKQMIFLLLALALCVAGCSKPQEEYAATDPAPTQEAEAASQPAQTQAPQAEATPQGSGTVPGDGTDPAGIPDLSSWACYGGSMEDGAAVYLAFDETGTKGVFMALYEDGQSALIAGEYRYDESTGVETIQASPEGPAIQFINTPVADGVFALQLGAQGQVEVEAADAAEAMACAARIQAEGQDITASFLAKLG